MQRKALLIILGILLLVILVQIFVVSHKNNKIEDLENDISRMKMEYAMDSMERANLHLEIAKDLEKQKILSEQADSLRKINSNRRNNERINFFKTSSDSINAIIIDKLLSERPN